MLLRRVILAVALLLTAVPAMPAAAGAARNHPLRTFLRKKGVEHLAPDCVFFWHHLDAARQSPYANAMAWVNGGSSQLAPTTNTSDAAGKWVWDSRIGQLVSVKQNLLGYGAPQEPSHTNIANPDITAWTAGAGAGISADRTIGPDGTNTGVKITDNASTTYANLAWALGSALTANAQYCPGVWVAAGDSGTASIVLWDSTASATRAQADFQQTGGVWSVKASDVGVGRVDGPYVVAGVVWYRLSVVCAANIIVNGNAHTMYVYPTEYTVNPGTAKYTWFWKPQCTQSTYPSSLIDADDTTRTADALRWVSTPVFNPMAAAGSLFGVIRTPYAATANAADLYPVALNGSDSANDHVGLSIDQATDRLLATAQSGGGAADTVSAGTLGAFAANTLIAYGITWNSAGMTLYVNGVSEGADATFTAPTALDRLEIGGRISTSTRFGGENFIVGGFTRALTAAEMRALTANPTESVWACAPDLPGKPVYCRFDFGVEEMATARLPAQTNPVLAALGR